MRRLALLAKTNPCRRSPAGLRVACALAALLLAFAPGRLSAATFTATLDREAVTVGETATLTLSFEGGEPKAIPTPPPQNNLQIIGQGSSRNVSIINGQVTASIAQSFALIPMQPGEYTIPALTAQVGNQVLTSQPLKLAAVKAATTAADSSGDKLAFFKLFLPRKEVYVGEVFAVEFQVYVRDGLANEEEILQSFERYGGCPLKAEGFSILKTAHAQRRRARIGNSTYGVATFVSSLSPLKTGALNIGSIEVPLTLQIPLPNQPRRDPRDIFSMFQQVQVEERRVSLSADPEPVTVQALPRDNVPADFNGAVGAFTLSFTAGPTNVAAGDPVTARIQLAGRGAFDSLSLPEQTAWRDFKTYPPTSKIETTDALGLQGSKTFEQVVVPQSADVKALPGVSFSFFDPEQKKYRTLTQPAVPLVVRPGGSVPTPTIAASAKATQDAPPPSQDIVHIKPRLGAVAQIAPPLVLQPWFLALQAVPLVAWLGALLWRRRTQQLANNPRLRRRRQVAQIVRQGLAELDRHATDKNSDEFFATLFRLLQEQLGERLDLPASAITEAVIEERLRPRNVPEATLAALHELFQTCNLARYAPIRSSQELAALIPKAEAVLRELQGVRT
jgi:hypothetical protein